MIEQALPILKDFRHIVLVEANDQVAFFAYPHKPQLKPEGCEVHRMTAWGEKAVAALETLANMVHAKLQGVEPQKKLQELIKPTSPLNHTTIAQAIVSCHAQECDRG